MTALTVSLMRNPYSNKLRSGYAGGYVPPLGSGTNYHVSKAGNDSNTGLSLAQSFLTISKAMSVIDVGGTIRLHATGGTLTTWTESTKFSPYQPKVNMSTTVVAAVAPPVGKSGQLGNQCTLMAAEGDEGLVQIQGANLVGGICTNGESYWTLWGLRIVDCFKHGVMSFESNTASLGATPILSSELMGTSVSFGWQIENCFVNHVYIDQANYASIDNCSAISPWGSYNMVVRNCKIRDVHDIGTRLTSGMQCYAQTGLLVDHCDIDSEHGIFFKDHWLESRSPRAPYANESEIRYTRLNTSSAAIYIGSKGNNTNESGGHYWHHNIFTGTYNSSSGFKAFIYCKQDTSLYQQSTKLRIENNIFDRGSATAMRGIVTNNFSEVISKGNIIIADSVQYSLENRSDGSSTPVNKLTYSDQNIFITPAFKNELQKAAPDEVAITSFATWKTKLAGDYRDLAYSNPDVYSTVLTSTTGLFTNRGTDYTYPVGSTAIGFMQDGSNAGAYQLGTETIGLLSVYSAGS